MNVNDQDYPGKALKEAMKKSKAQSIEDLLRQQIEKGEYYDGGGSGGRKPPRGGGGGGGFGGFWDKSFGGMSDEILQVVLAAIGFLVLVLSVSLSLSRGMCVFNVYVNMCINNCLTL